MSKFTSTYLAFSDAKLLQGQGTGFNNEVKSISTQSDGSIIVGGLFTSLNGTTRNRLVKLSPAGAVDTTFYSNLGTNAVNNNVYAVAVQSNDAIIIGGTFTSIGGTTRNRISRISSTGTVDASFYSSIGTGGANGAVWALAVQPSDQYILVGGEFTSIGGTAPDGLARLTTTGSKDSTFQTNLGSGFNVGIGPVRAIAVQADGKILVGGGFTTLNGTSRVRLVRLNSNGTVDTSFYTNLGASFDSTVLTICVQADGKILVGGDFTTFNGNSRVGLVRLNSDGTEDSSFYTNYIASGSPAGSQVGSVIENTVNSDVYVGYNHSSGATFGILQVSSTGTEVRTFATSDAWSCFTLSNDSLVLFGTDFSGYYVYKFYINGVSWTAPGGITRVYATPVDSTTLVAQATGKMLEVSPGTVYTVTINSETYAINNANTFGSLYSWTGTGALEVSWVE